MLLLIALAAAFQSKLSLTFDVLHSETSLPIFGSVCPNKDELVLTLKNGTTVIYSSGKRTFVETSGYASLCTFDGIVGLQRIGNGTTTDRMKNVYIPGHIYWFAWGINRFGSSDKFFVANQTLMRNNVELETVNQVYGCSVSFFQYPRVKCNSHAHSSITYIPGMHLHGNQILRTYASYDDSPSFSTMHDDIIETNLPDTLTYIRYYANADSAVYCVFLDNDLFNVARLQLH